MKRPKSFGPLLLVALVSITWAGAAVAPDWAFQARIATPWDYPEGTSKGWEEAVDRAVADPWTVGIRGSVSAPFFRLAIHAIVGPVATKER